MTTCFISLMSLLFYTYNKLRLHPFNKLICGLKTDWMQVFKYFSVAFINEENCAIQKHKTHVSDWVVLMLKG